MTRKLLGLTTLLVLTFLASWVPRAEASGGCSATFCATRPASTPCGCPPGTDFPGKLVTCGSWNRVGGCWAE